MLTQQELTEIYKNFDNEKIISLAKYESKKLTDNAVPVLKNEILRRQLGKNLIDWINLERNFFKGFELETLIKKIKNSKCSNCQIQKDDIKGFYIHNCSLTHDPKEVNLIFCNACGNKLRQKNYIISGTFGWISPKGLIKVPFYFLGEIVDTFFREKQSNKIIKEFILENTGKIRHLGITHIEKIIEDHNHYQLNLERTDNDYFFEFLF